MARYCQKCGAEIPEGSPVCRSCFEPVKREGILGWLRRLLGGGGVSSGKAASPGSTTVNVKVSERIKIRNPLTGELHEYQSLDEVPAEFREMIRKAREAAARGQGRNDITVTDSEGKVQTYHSLEELPSDLQTLFKKTRKEGS